MRNDNTVDQKLTNMGADLEEAESKIATVLTSLEAIMPCLPGHSPLKVEYGHLKKTYGLVRAAAARIVEIRERLPKDALQGWSVVDSKKPDSQP